MSDIAMLGVCGSLQARSSNRSLLESLPRLAPAGTTLRLFEGLRALPHFDLDQSEGEPPAPVRAWRDALRASDVVFIATPEYGHSLPGALKNAIDWVFATGELYQKLVVITAASAGPERGLRGLAALRQTLGALDVRVLGGDPVPRGAEGEAALRALLSEAVAVVRRVRAGEPAQPDVALPESIEGLVRGTLLREPLVARLLAAPSGGAITLERASALLTQLVSERVQVATPGGPLLILARAEALLATEHGALGGALIEGVLAGVDETPALTSVLEQLGPLARRHLGL